MRLQRILYQLSYCEQFDECETLSVKFNNPRLLHEPKKGFQGSFRNFRSAEYLCQTITIKPQYNSRFNLESTLTYISHHRVADSEFPCIYTGGGEPTTKVRTPTYFLTNVFPKTGPRGNIPGAPLDLPMPSQTPWSTFTTGILFQDNQKRGNNLMFSQKMYMTVISNSWKTHN